MITTDLDCEVTPIPASTDGGASLPNNEAAVPDSEDGGLKSLVRAEIERLLPSLLNIGRTPAVASEQSVGAELRTALDELEATKLELQRLRIEKSAQDRDVYLKDQLRTLGVRNIDLAFRAVREDIERDADGEWIAATSSEKLPATNYLRSFIMQNPELMPARMISGSGMPSRFEDSHDDCDLDQIRPGMDPASMRRAKDAVVRIIAQSKRAL